jgi:peptidyl-prolyl cis-trans isomerase SurA
MLKKLILSLSLSCGVAFADLVNAVAVYVDNEAITLYDILKTKDKYGLADNQAVDFLVDNILKEKESRSLGIEVSQYEIEQEIENIAKSNGMDSDGFKEFLESKLISWTDHKKEVENKILTRKLYKRIAYSKIKFPTNEELKDYYNKNIDKYSSFKTIELVEYKSANQDELKNVKSNPMYMSNSVERNSYKLSTSQISPKLLGVLLSTKVGSFTDIINLSDTFVLFYVKNKIDKEKIDFTMVKNAILEEMLKSQESKIIKDHFDNLRINSDINIVR